MYFRSFWGTALTQSLNKRQKIRTMVWELSMTQVAYVGPYQAQLAHISCWGRWGPWGGSGGVQSLKIGHFWTFLPDFPGLQNQVLEYFWVNWTLFDPHARLGEVSHIDFRSTAILSRPSENGLILLGFGGSNFKGQLKIAIDRKSICETSRNLVCGSNKVQLTQKCPRTWFWSPGKSRRKIQKCPIFGLWTPPEPPPRAPPAPTWYLG